MTAINTLWRKYCLTTSCHLSHCPIAKGYFQDHEYELLFEAAGPALLGYTWECWIFLMSTQMMTRCQMMSQLEMVHPCFFVFFQVGEMLSLIIHKHFVTVYTCWWCFDFDVNLALSDKPLSRSTPFNFLICPSLVIMPKRCYFCWSKVLLKRKAFHIRKSRLLVLPSRFDLPKGH